MDNKEQVQDVKPVEENNNVQPSQEEGKKEKQTDRQVTRRRTR